MSRQNKFYQEREIARLLVLAQIASDYGKNGSELAIVGDKKAIKLGYAIKVAYIKKALEIIDSCNPSAFNYYVKEEGDQNGYPSVLTYFDISINGERYQMSFHTPLNKANEIAKWVGKGRPTHWVLKAHLGGKREDKPDSSDVGEILTKTYGLKTHNFSINYIIDARKRCR